MASESSSIDAVGLRRRHERPSDSVTTAVPSDSSSIPSTSHPSASDAKQFSVLQTILSLFGLSDRHISKDTQSADAAASHLKKCLSQYKSEHSPSPNFELSSFRDAVSTARATSKFLLVYLHSPIHEDTSAYCENVLNTTEFCSFLSESQLVIAWAGDISYSEGYSVSLSFGAAQFPFIALVTCQTRGVSILEKFTGKWKLSRGNDLMGRVYRECASGNSITGYSKCRRAKSANFSNGKTYGSATV